MGLETRSHSKPTERSRGQNGLPRLASLELPDVLEKKQYKQTLGLARRELAGLRPVEKLAPNPIREQKKSEQGCAVRGLASALHASPTEAEWQMRFDQMEKGISPELQAQLNKPFLSFQQKTEISRDHYDQEVGNLIRTYGTHDSKLGEAIRGKEFEEHGRLDEKGIRTLIGSGRQVMITGSMTNNEGTETGTRHQVHLQIDKNGKLFAASDSGQHVELAKDGAYNTFAFAEKGTPPAVIERSLFTGLNGLKASEERLFYNTNANNARKKNSAAFFN